MASDNKKKKAVSFTTAVGTAKYPWLNKPDFEYNAEGEWKCQLIMSPKDAKSVTDAVRAVIKSEFGDDDKNIRIPWTNEENGDVVFKCTTKFQPRFYQSDGEVIPEKAVPQLWGGSKLRLGGEISPYNKGKNSRGISLRFNRVQVIEPVGGDNASNGIGFDAVEDGWVNDMSEVGFDHEDEISEGARF